MNIIIKLTALLFSFFGLLKLRKCRYKLPPHIYFGGSRGTPSHIIIFRRIYLQRESDSYHRLIGLVGYLPRHLSHSASHNYGAFLFCQNKNTRRGVFLVGRTGFGSLTLLSEIHSLSLMVFHRVTLR
jgi:hypothetical protein